MRPDAKRCGAKTRSGAPCQSWARLNGRCRMHGGSAPRGMAAPRFVTGRYSMDLPTRMIARYEQAAHDPDLLELRHELAVLEARLSDVLGRVDTGESGHIWKALGDAAADVRLARQTKNQELLGDALTTILSLISAGHADYAAWQEVRSLIEQRRKTVESERKRLQETNATISIEKALLLVGAIGGILNSRITDKRLLAEINRDFEALLSRPEPELLEVSS